MTTSAEAAAARDLTTRTSRRGRLVVAGVVLGVGLGGLFDGIVFHQILQWHHLVSTPTPPDAVPTLELNTLLVGLFHAAAWWVAPVGGWLLLFSEGGRHQGGGSRILAG